MEIETKMARTKSGGNTMIAMIPQEMVGKLEALHWDASRICADHGCSHYKVIGLDGRVVAAGKAGALPTQEETARTHGDSSEWSRD